MPVPLFLCFVIGVSFAFGAACSPSRGDDDDSSAAGDDDTSAAGDDDDSGQSGDDDDAVSSCDAPQPPYSLSLSGAASASIDVASVDCRDLSGDNWSVSYVNDLGWDIRFTAGPLVEGETLETGISITVQNNGKVLSFSGRTQFDHVAAVEVLGFAPDEGRYPCGYLTTEALLSPTNEELSLAPQPLPFHCTSGS